MNNKDWHPLECEDCKSKFEGYIYDRLCSLCQDNEDRLYSAMNDMERIGNKDLKVKLGLIKLPKPEDKYAPFKQMKRTPELFKRGENCTFNQETMQAYSYGWWRFVEVVDNKVLFNNYSYSHSTSKHQWNTQRLLGKLGIKIDFEFACRKGFQDGYESAVQDYKYKIKQLKELIKTPGTHKKKNEERKNQIANIQCTLGIVKKFQRLRAKGN